ncbi:MAG: AAA family ATPase [Candidatus Aegiribacteria sp.]|nr:AAA family ATPase [Candidatus Aegiribacteria sp.]MBD3294538.1 AAA family ATPase [Candidatus Fermentibacteria bacterium]
MASIFIMRGLPGAGKSTWVSRNCPDAHVCSADDFFVGEDGVYRFDGELIPQAHALCLRRFVSCMESLSGNASDGPDSIVVDNTGLRAWEIAPYYSLGEAYGHSVEIVHVECDSETALARNVHGVSRERMQEMSENLKNEELPSFWKLRRVDGTGD